MSNTYCLVVLTTEIFTAHVKRNSVVSWVSPRPKAFWECLPTPNGNQRHSLTPPPTLVLTSGSVATVKTDVKNSQTRLATGPSFPASHAQHIIRLQKTHTALESYLYVESEQANMACSIKIQSDLLLFPNTSATTNSKEF